jgi:hypothetical protein
MACICHPSNIEKSKTEGSWFRPPWANMRPCISKKKKKTTKKTQNSWRYDSSECKVLSSNPNIQTTRNKKQNKTVILS